MTKEELKEELLARVEEAAREEVRSFESMVLESFFRGLHTGVDDAIDMFSSEIDDMDIDVEILREELRRMICDDCTIDMG